MMGNLVLRRRRRLRFLGLLDDLVLRRRLRLLGLLDDLVLRRRLRLLGLGNRVWDVKHQRVLKRVLQRRVVRR